jgi:hypothetical protein
MEAMTFSLLSGTSAAAPADSHMGAPFAASKRHRGAGPATSCLSLQTLPIVAAASAAFSADSAALCSARGSGGPQLFCAWVDF